MTDPNFKVTGRVLTVSESVRKKNPHLYGAGQDPVLIIPSPEKKRIRQSSKPLLNQLETEWALELKRRFPSVRFHAQAWRVKISASSWFKVDFCGVINGVWTAFETKGNKGKNIDRGLLALKCAAAQFPEVMWILCWKEDSKWLTQIVRSE